MQKFSIKNFTKRNKFTRMCIGEAVITLMKEKSFEKITVSDITRRAGVSRMTFYKYYHTKEEILESYLQEIIAGYIEENRDNFSKEYPNRETTENALHYFDQYADFFLVVAHAGLYSLLIDAVNQYMEEMVIPHYDVSPYRIYYYAGALLNVFIKWEEAEKKNQPFD